MDADKLQALGGLVDEVDAAGPPTPEQIEQRAAEDAKAVQQSQAEDMAREWGMVAYAIGGALSMFAPELRQVYTEDACLSWGRAVVPVAEKYGWTGARAVPELGLALATVSLAAPTVIVIRHRLQHPEADKGGMLSKLRDWWRSKRAAKAAQIVREATDKAGEGMSNGS